MVHADIELGGLDQKFSLLTGRDVQSAYKQDKQDIMLFDYLIGTDGKEKMSKSIGNYIAIEDAPNDMYGKVMSIPDKLIGQYFTLATDTTAEEIATITASLKKKATNPRDVKADLARRIVSLYHGEKLAQAAEFEFTHVFRKKGQPSEIERIGVRPGEHSILNLMVSHHLASSRSEARRLVEQGGVKVDQRTITDWEKPIVAVNGAIIQVGKRKFVKLVISE
jgi:tyrosyl-tRNA synthetase